MFSNEPVVWMGLVRAVVVLVTAFGLELTAEQTGGIYLVAEAITMLVTRRNVTPNALAEYRVDQGYRPTKTIAEQQKTDNLPPAA